MRRGSALARTLAILAMFAAWTTSVPAADPSDAPRTEILLNGMWETRADAASAPWTPLRVPQPLIAPKRRAVVWYRLRFDLPRELRRDRRVLLAFERAGHHVKVTLNDRLVGEHYGARLPFSFDVTDALRDGGDNELVVWAAPADPANARPGGVASADEAKAYDLFHGGEPAGWYPAGIFADVTLQLVGAVRVEHVFVRPSFREKAIGVELEVANYGRAAATVTVRNDVRSRDGAPTAVHLDDEAITIPGGGRASVTRRSGFPDALLWPDGGDGPPLYVLRTRVVVDGRTIDLDTTRFGFRDVWSEGADLVLNGRKVRIAADIVTAVSSRQRLLHFFDALRSIGVNAIFLHWNDGTRTFYDAADEAGMLVVPELYCAGPPQITMPVVAPSGWVDDMAREYEAWVTLRRNHPSIALWSAYDIPPASGARPADLQRFDDTVRAADPTRPILGRDVLDTPIVDTHRFLGDPRERFRVAYEALLSRSRTERRPVLVDEIVDLVRDAPDDVRALLERFGRDGIVGWGGLSLAGAAFHPRVLAVTWPSLSGNDARPPSPGGVVGDVVNWTDPSRPPFMRTDFGRSLRRLAPQTLGIPTVARPFVRSPELLVVAPDRCGGRGWALAAPTSGAGGIERGTLLDAEGKGWLLLPEPGTYRVRVACDDGSVATTVEAKGVRFTGEPGFGNLQEVRLDSAR
jgi:hypothetical protein